MKLFKVEIDFVDDGYPDRAITRSKPIYKDGVVSITDIDRWSFRDGKWVCDPLTVEYPLTRIDNVRVSAYDGPVRVGWTKQ